MSNFEPIAIVGMGCRFPGGAHDPDTYAQLIAAARDAVRETPSDRWSNLLHHDPDRDAPGRSYVNRAGFLDADITAFDAAFFGISPREAASLDPQQRLLLEVTWEAFEDAGLRAEQLAGSPTGVFIGGFTLDSMISRFAQVDAIDSHTATSSSMTLLSNRLSYTFDLRGPSVTVDTACSSSLVAVHLACAALQRGECEVAVAGGVNVMLMPNYQIVMCKGRFLAPDGRSKTFEADADGYGRGEGAGVLVLMPLSQALAKGHPIHAVLRGTGVNQDGATDGVPMPNGEAQREVIQQTLTRAGLEASEVGYIEAHGTGTKAGDPVETGALGAVYGAARREPCPIGSVKANIGHLEAAAGVAGLMKAVLAVRNREIPPHVPLRKPNPDIDFEGLRLRVPQAPEAWPPGKAIAAVNSFGYGGTNAHAIVEEPPRVATAGEGRPRTTVVLPVAARSTAGLRGRAEQLADVLASAELGDVAHTLGSCRSHHPVRAAVIADTASEAIEALHALGRGERDARIATAERVDGGLCWVFTGMGPQWWGMGQQLYRREPVFRAQVDEIDALFQRIGGRSILERMLADEASSTMERNDVAQPSNFVLQAGLVALLRERGPAPDAILGHSVGEVAAAWASGGLSLEDAVTVVVHRSRLQQTAAGRGSMLAVGVAADEAMTLIADLPDTVIAAFNSPHMVTLAGPHAALDVVAQRCGERDVFQARVRVQVPYHGPAMDPIGDELRRSLAGLRPRAPKLRLYSTLRGAAVEGAVHDAEYWWRNTRDAVQLQRAIESAVADGLRAFLEVGPHPVLSTSIGANLDALGIRGLKTAVLRRGQPETTTFAHALGTLYAAGFALPWDRVAPGARVELPAWPWQRERHWKESAEAKEARLGRANVHPLLRQARPGPQRAWHTRLDRGALGWVTDHRVQGAVVLPGAAILEACLAAHTEIAAGEAAWVRDVRFEAATVVDEGTAHDLGLTVADDGRVELHGRSGDGEWTRRATARLEPTARYATPPAVDLAALRQRVTEVVDIDGFYAALATRGLGYGPAFRGVRRLWAAQGEALAELSIGTPTDGYRLHPALLDAAFQSLLGAAVPQGEGLLLPVAVERLWVGEPVGPSALCHARLRSGPEGHVVGDLTLLDPHGRVLAEVVGLRCAAVERTEAAPPWLYRTQWQPATLVPGFPIRRATVIGDAPELVEALRSRGVEVGEAGEVTIVVPGEGDPMGEAAATMVLEATRRAEGRLVVVTRGAAELGAVPPCPAASAVWGLTRVVMTERPDLRPTLVDVEHGPAEAIDAVLAEPTEEELAIRDGACFAARLARIDAESLAQTAPRRRVAAAEAAMELVVQQRGRLDSLTWRAAERVAPAAGEVEVELHAASLNFKDVMKAMGMLSDTALERTYLGTALGMEGAGTVVRVGPGVEHLAVGDDVFVYKGGALRSHAVVDARFVVRRPATMGAIDAATVFVFLTAWHALVHVGRVAEGDTVLVHSAAGGVGQAAVQIARSRGAVVLATAGTPEKRALLREQGIEHVFDSRTLDFVDGVRRATAGRGVNVVLNALAGPALERSLDLLAPGGVFLELGKKDIADDRRLGLLPFNRALTFAAIDLDRMANERPSFFAPTAREVMQAFADGVLHPLPIDVVPAARVEDGFRALASGAQVGKIVVDLRDGEVDLAPAASEQLSGTWLVTGGLGGFGRRMGQWLAERGATRLVLASRRGHAEDGESIAVPGVEVEAVALDVTDREAVRALVDRLPDLCGVVHAAMVLDDGPLTELDASRLGRTFAAKAHGAWNLHLATRQRSLRHFVCCSSISATVGNPGQGAYAAANAALDGLCALRRAEGLPGLAVAFGALAEVGVVARDAAVERHLQTMGLQAMPPAAALQLLGSAMASAPARLVLCDIDWDAWTRATAETSWSRLEALVGARTSAGLDPRQALLAMPEAEREAELCARLTGAAASVFRMEAERIDASRSLRDYGLDSLMAVELAVGIHHAVGLEISAMDLLAGRSLQALAERLLARLGASAAPREEVAAAPSERILVSAPYNTLQEVKADASGAQATVRPDRIEGAETTAVSSAEVGRHLAILGSVAAAARWPQPGRHVWPVHHAVLELDETAPELGDHFELRSRCTEIDVTGSHATSQGEMIGAGQRVGRLEVRYHVIPEAQFRAMFADRRRATAEAGPSPYARLEPVALGEWDGRSLEGTLATVRAEDCAGHFAGLPALPVSIMGRHVMEVVAAAIGGQSGWDEVACHLQRAEIETFRFVWADEPVRYVARPEGEGWVCEVRTGDELAAVFKVRVRAWERRAAAEVGE